MKFCILTLGCKVNQFESHAIESYLISRGHIQAQAGKGCDVCIINTCAVTAESARKSRQSIRRVKKLEPDALIAVFGCFSQLDPSSAASLGADLVGGTHNRLDFMNEIEKRVHRRADLNNSQPSLVSRQDTAENTEFISHAILLEPDTGAADTDYPPAFEELSPGAASGRTRALLKIQDGCDNFCAYCVVPYARGRSRSLPPDRASEHARLLGEQGFLEIVITGIEISSYGKDLPGTPSLIKLIHGIEKAAPRTRLRLGSLDPRVLTADFCDELSSVQNLCGHFHLSLQSGCNDTLRRMGRKYESSTVFDAITLLRQRFPDCAVTADLITGFPGETDIEFNETIDFIKSVGFSQMHVFPFSPRPGTPAALMPLQIEKSVRTARAGIAAGIASEMTRSFIYDQVGKSVNVLFERKRAGFWVGHSENYLEVSVKNAGAKNTILPVRITGFDAANIYGEVV